MERRADCQHWWTDWWPAHPSQNKPFSANGESFRRRGSDHGSKPVARLVPVGKVKGKRQPGPLKGKLRVGPEFFEPLPMSELTAWE